MRCREAARAAGAVVDGEAPVGTRWRVRLHLALCRDCARFVRQVRLTRDALGRAGPDPLDPAREDALVRAVVDALGRDGDGSA